MLTHGFTSEYAYKCKKAYHPASTVNNPVIGQVNQAARYDSCGIARIGDRIENLSDARCGVSGRFWEPKHKKDLFKYIKHVSK
jgi:hypothetical protein